MDRVEAEALVRDLVSNENLINHMLCVEGAMRFYARLHNQDEELWGLAGLLHDADWERYPHEHPQHIMRTLREKGANNQIVQAINAHGGKDATQPRTLMDKVLFACDELSGFVVAVARMRPGKLRDLEQSSVVKKLKDKGFASNVSREDIYAGADLLRLALADHVTNIIAALRPFEATIFQEHV